MDVVTSFVGCGGLMAQRLLGRTPVTRMAKLSTRPWICTKRGQAPCTSQCQGRRVAGNQRLQNTLLGVVAVFDHGGTGEVRVT